MTTTYLGSGDTSRHRRDYRPEWLENLADDVTMEGSVATGSAEGPEAIRATLGFARTLYDYQEFNFVGPYGDHGFVEDYTSVVRGEPVGSVEVVRFNEAGQAARIVVNHRPLGSVLLWSQLMRRQSIREVLPQPRRGERAARGGRCDSGVARYPAGGGVTAAEQARCEQARVPGAIYRKETR